MKKLFGNINVSWKFLIIFAILIGILVGILNRIPILYNTSLQDIAIYFDIWIILAIFIIVNSKSAKEAMLKCFIFFLISQPLIYFTEVLIDTFINNKNFNEMFSLYFKNYYVGAGWLFLTILTIPGSLIAYEIKKDNILASIILSVATFYLAFRGTTDLIKIISYNFPYHLINSLICLFFAYYLILIIIKSKRNRLIAIILTSLGIIYGIISIFINNATPINIDEMISFDEEIIDCTTLDNEIATCKISDDKTYVTIYSSSKVGKTEISITTKDNRKYSYIVDSNSKEFNINEK